MSRDIPSEWHGFRYLRGFGPRLCSLDLDLVGRDQLGLELALPLDGALDVLVRFVELLPARR
jgi:hypothetical protein